MAKERGDLSAGHARHAGAEALQLESMHGWGITERIEQWSESVLQLGQGTLYPALYRLERQGLIRSEWKVTENNRRARYYSLTRQGAAISPMSWRNGNGCPARSIGRPGSHASSGEARHERVQ